MFHLNNERGRPVYLQITDQVERRIASGALEPGDALPSVRALARQLRVNPNTVVRAYQELEHRGLIDRRRGAGTFVAEGDAAASAEELLDLRSRDFVREVEELGCTREACLAAVARAWAEENDDADGAAAEAVDLPKGAVRVRT